MFEAKYEIVDLLSLEDIFLKKKDNIKKKNPNLEELLQHKTSFY